MAAELDVARHTVRRALQLSEDEGVLAGRGLGRSRSITAAGAITAFQRPLRVAILRHDARLIDAPQSSISLMQIMHALEAVGHTAFFCKKSQIELKHDVARISRQLETARADVWVVESGSRPLLEWCVGQQTPCLALYGRATNQPLASVGVQEQVSLIYADNDAVLDWCHPPISRMQWDSTPIARNVVHWVNFVRKGNPGRKINDVTAEFIPGGSIGPVWKGGSRTSP